jgi:TPR repeat protein
MRKLVATSLMVVVVLLGSAEMSWGADFQKGINAYCSGDYATALREWQPLAEKGSAQVKYNLGSMYERGQGVP